MLTGDNVDVYSNYGLYVKNYAPLLTMPQYKSSSITTTDWHESDGVHRLHSSLECIITINGIKIRS